MSVGERPLTSAEHDRLQPQAATEPEPQVHRALASAYLDGRSPPTVGTTITRVGSGRRAAWRVELTTGPREQATPPVADVEEVKRPKRPSAAARRGCEGHRPGWAELAPSPRLIRKRRRPEVRRGDERLDPLTIFPPEDRRIYNDTRYPWCCVCQVVTNEGAGSGVLIGRRLVLTASHGIDWSNPWATVTAHRVGDFNLGVAQATLLLCWTKVDDPGYSTIDEDYVVLVVDPPLGDQLGWLGVRTYDSSWDGQEVWRSIGYTGVGDIGGGLWPVYQRDFALDEDDSDFGAGRAMSTDDGDFMPGQSGSPVFAWFEGEDFPRVVAVCSANAGGGGDNYMSGGSWLTELVVYGRQHYS